MMMKLLKFQRPRQQRKKNDVLPLDSSVPTTDLASTVHRSVTVRVTVQRWPMKSTVTHRNRVSYIKCLFTDVMTRHALQQISSWMTAIISSKTEFLLISSNSSNLKQQLAKISSCSLDTASAGLS